jgi:hypothetical protein
MTTGSLSFLKLHSPHQKVYDINFVNFGETLTRNIFCHNITEILLKTAEKTPSMHDQ